MSADSRTAAAGSRTSIRRPARTDSGTPRSETRSPTRSTAPGPALRRGDAPPPVRPQPSAPRPAWDPASRVLQAAAFPLNRFVSSGTGVCSGSGSYLGRAGSERSATVIRTSPFAHHSGEKARRRRYGCHGSGDQRRRLEIILRLARLMSLPILNALPGRIAVPTACPAPARPRWSCRCGCSGCPSAW